MSCTHTVCDHTCECTCDTCQENFERNWDIYVAEKGLCVACGMPKEMTVERLSSTKEMHFYLPCKDCNPLFLERMKAAKLCPTCQEALSGVICIGCTCTEDVEACPCRQCILARKNRKDK
jgi:hypothetical protein